MAELKLLDGIICEEAEIPLMNLVGFTSSCPVEIEDQLLRMQPMQVDLLNSRLATRKALELLVEDVLNKYSPDNNDGVEYGCGPHALFYRLLLPERFRKGWQMFEIHHGSVEHANRLLEEEGYANRVKQGNFFGMSQVHSNLPLIVGSSSWDATFNLEESMKEVARTLQPGGQFIHFQNVGPSYALLMHYALKRILGVDHISFFVLMGNSDKKIKVRRNPKNHQAVHQIKIGDEWVYGIDFFYQELEKAAKAADLEIVYNGAIIKEAIVKIGSHGCNPPDNDFDERDNVIFMRKGVVWDAYRKDVKVEPGYIKQDVETSVFVARRKAA